MKKIVSALLFCALLLSLAACSQKSPTAQETEPESSAARTVTDSFGREVTIPAEVKAIVCTGSGALRMVTYLQCTDRLVGVEDCDKEYADSTLRDYAYVYHDTFDALPSIGKGGGTANTAYVEELIRLQPGRHSVRLYPGGAGRSGAVHRDSLRVHPGQEHQLHRRQLLHRHAGGRRGAGGSGAVRGSPAVHRRLQG